MPVPGVTLYVGTKIAPRALQNETAILKMWYKKNHSEEIKAQKKIYNSR